MNIEARVDALTEREAKDWLLELLTAQQSDASIPVTVGGDRLPRQQAVALKALRDAQPRVVTRDRLMEILAATTHSGEAADTDVLNAVMYRLRRVLRRHGIPLETIRGLGYRLPSCAKSDEDAHATDAP